MPILFSAVACDKTVISKFASCDGNFMEILEQVLSKITLNNIKMTYSHGHYLFHYIVANQYFYFCITEKMCQRSRAFLFLNEIQRKFNCKDNGDFSRILAAEMYRYSEDYNTIVIRKGELDELNKIRVGCSESILGEKSLYVNRKEHLTYGTITYVGKAPEQIVVTFKRPKFYMAVVVIIILVLGIIIYFYGPISSTFFLGLLFFMFYKRFLKS